MADHNDDLDEDEQALLAWLRDGATGEGDVDDIPAVFGDSSTPTQDLEEELRSLGLNYLERQAIRHPRRSRGNSERYKRTNLIRFGWYIDQIVDWTDNSVSRGQVIAAWVALSKGDIDVARRWWEAGIDPCKLSAARELMEEGLHPRDLAICINSKTIAEHLKSGSSIKWCLNALRWHRPTG